LVGKPDGKRPLGRPRRKWNDDTETDLKKLVWRVWTGLIWLRPGKEFGALVNAVMNLRVGFQKLRGIF
jgi:hypothetical protein